MSFMEITFKFHDSVGPKSPTITPHHFTGLLHRARFGLIRSTVFWCRNSPTRFSIHHDEQRICGYLFSNKLWDRLVLVLFFSMLHACEFCGVGFLVGTIGWSSILRMCCTASYQCLNRILETPFFPFIWICCFKFRVRSSTFKTFQKLHLRQVSVFAHCEFESHVSTLSCFWMENLDGTKIW